MQEIFKQLEFRSFSYEDDPEAVADMHCCAEVLEGSWFDKADTCKMHAKVVVRSPGSSWVVAYNNLIFAHADLIKSSTNDAIILAWRLHENFRYPQVARKLFEGLKQEALRRECTGIVIFADSERVGEELKMINLTPDRSYQYCNPANVESKRILRHERVVLHTDEIAKLELRPFLGSPLPPAYIIQKAFMGADYCVFRHLKPATFEIFHNQNTYLACYDGREWHVFRQGNFSGEAEAIGPLLKTISSLESGQIMLSEKAMQAGELISLNNGVYHDYYCAL